MSVDINISQFVTEHFSSHGDSFMAVLKLRMFLVKLNIKIPVTGSECVASFSERMENLNEHRGLQ